MDERIKNLVIIVLGVLCLLLLIGTISSCSGAYKQKLARDKEMAGRLDLEEKMSKSSQERVAMEERVKSKDKNLQEAVNELAGIKKELLEVAPDAFKSAGITELEKSYYQWDRPRDLKASQKCRKIYE